MLAILAARPLRLRSFTAIRLGIELRRTGADFELALGADALKTGGYYDASLPVATRRPRLPCRATSQKPPDSQEAGFVIQALRWRAEASMDGTTTFTGPSGTDRSGD